MPENNKPVYLNRQLWIVFAVTLTAVMSVSSITPAFPLIADQFDIPVSRTGLLITFYFMPGVVLTPLFGILADKYGRVTLLAPALMVFAIAGVACAFMSTFRGLIGARIVQGVGAASIGAINLAIIGDLFDGNRRTKAMGYNATIFGVGTAIYPAIGGGLAEFAWYFPFFMPAVGIPVAAAVWFHLDVSPPGLSGERRRLDFRAIFANMVSNQKVLGALSISFAIFVVLFGPYLAYFPVLLDNNLGMQAGEIGISLSAASFLGAITAGFAGKLSEQFGLLTILSAGFGLYVVVLGLIPFFDNIILVAILLAVYGISQGLNIPTSQSLIAQLAPPRVRGTYMAVNSTVYKIAQTISPVLSGFLHEWYGLSWVFVAASGFTGIVFVGLLSVTFLGSSNNGEA